jgi:FtsP/CotA-like multicopper oxidase with cupredoxin domain
MKDMGMDMSSMGGMEGMDMKQMAGSGVDPTAEQNRSRLLADGAAAAMSQSPSGHATPAMVGMATAGMSGGQSGGSMQGMDMSGHQSGSSMQGMDMSGHQGGSMPGMGMSGKQAGSSMPGMNMGTQGGMDMNMRDFSNAPEVKKGPGVQTIAPMPMDRTGEPGQGLENVGHRVLVYTDLVALDRNPDVRAPSRSIDVHLTGNMERFMWSFDGVKMSDAMEPIPFINGERVRVNLINDTMMGHPIHLHGHFFELVTGHGDHAPRKHTVLVAPGGKVTFDLTADVPGDWAFHCHLLYHMMAGMMRVVSIRNPGDAA